MIFVLLIRIFLIFENLSLSVSLLCFVIKSGFMALIFGKVVGKATTEGGCCITNVGIRCYVTTNNLTQLPKMKSEMTESAGAISCLNFWDEAWWYLSLRIFGLLFSSLFLFPQRFGRYVLWPSSGVCRTREPTRNFELWMRALCQDNYSMVKCGKEREVL